MHALLLMLSGAYGMHIGGGNLYRVGQPIHESMTLAALIHSNYRLDNATLYSALRQDPARWPEINDFVRGSVWNDDPECLLFDEQSANSFTYSEGIQWSVKYLAAQYAGQALESTNIIGRSHLGDLQFLHAMGSKQGEAPEETKAKMLTWLEIMYKVATGEDYDAANGVTFDDVASLTCRPQEDPSFGQCPAPYATGMVRTMLTCGHPSPADLRHRALGSAMHVVSDSFARGHARRVLLNPEDLAEPKLSSFTMKPGTFGRWGPILNFHTYLGQDGTAHAKFDGPHTDEEFSELHLAELDSFNELIGVRSGIEACIHFANFWHARTKWNDGVRQWLEDDLFAIDEHATGSDTTVA